MTEEESQMVREMHDFWHKPDVPGKPTRAAQVDEVLTAMRAGKMGARVVVWISGAIITVGGAIAIARGWIPK